MLTPPTSEQAVIFAQMLEFCIPADAAIAYLLPELAEEVQPEVARSWEKHPRVRAARFDLREWMSKTPDSRMDYALERTYNGMAIFLALHNIGELETAKLAKANTFREALEKKLAGTAGRGDGIAQFWADAVAGKIKFPTPEVVQ